MATVIEQLSSDGSRRRCDGRCHYAKRAKCTCICGGRLHGLGRAPTVQEVLATIGGREGIQLPAEIGQGRLFSGAQDAGQARERGKAKEKL